MTDISVIKKGNYPVSAKKIKEAVARVLTEKGIVSDSEASVAIVSAKAMRRYVDSNYHSNSDGGDDREHPVLSFPAMETKENFVYPPDGILHLGEIVISYDWAKREANKTGRLVEEVVLEMATHGALHLVGIHHD